MHCEQYSTRTFSLLLLNALAFTSLPILRPVSVDGLSVANKGDGYSLVYIITPIDVGLYLTNASALSDLSWLIADAIEFREHPAGSRRGRERGCCCVHHSLFIASFPSLLISGAEVSLVLFTRYCAGYLPKAKGCGPEQHTYSQASG